MEPQGLQEGQGLSHRLPASLDQITVDWLRLVLKNEDLRSFEVLPMAAGFGIQGIYAHLRLHYRRPSSDSPSRIFVKLPQDRPNALRLAGLEVQFYRNVAPLIRQRIPRCYYSATDSESGRSVLLLEDVRGRAGDSLAGYRIDEALLLFREVASLHAQWWEHPKLVEWTWLIGATRNPSTFIDRARQGMALFREKHADLVPGWVLATAEKALARLPDIFEAIWSRPATLNHGDLQLDNVCFDLPDAPLLLLDWQLARRAPAATDIGWFLVHATPVAERRRDEEKLLLAYQEVLSRSGVSDYPVDRLRSDIGVVFLLMLLNLVNATASKSFQGPRREQVLSAFWERLIAMLEDHDVWRALREHGVRC